MNKLKMDDKEIEDIIETLNEVQEDATVPKNVRIKIQEITGTLKEDTQLSIKINKALNELDEIASDVNLQPYTRTQIWNIVSVLEKMQ
jgi:uncharacterized protein (UPF0147 family)|tara:strand:- start:390 stop:653 length:264 start_codon:yes stop_codon:yes gene_type:complete